MDVINQTIGKHHTVINGDCVDACKGLPDNSIHFSIFSPPFASLYTYSDSPRDMGNCKDHAEFMTTFGFLVDELYRVIMPGRIVAVHCMEIPMMKERDGVVGFRDFSGDIIRLFQSRGFVMHAPRLTIWKDPLIEATRTKALGLMHKQICKDSAMCRPGSPDYLLTLRKPGDNPEPVEKPDGFVAYVGTNKIKGTPGYFPPPLSGISCYSHNAWRGYASPVWFDINQSNTLNATSAREEKDERHICPLQLDVIERAIQLWTNPNDIVLSPFGGIGSEGFVAVKAGRRAVLVELKESYYKQACANLERAERERDTVDMVDLMEASE